MRYVVVEGDSPDELANAVNEHLASGWETLGGVSVGMAIEKHADYSSHTYVYVQAMQNRQLPPGEEE